MKFKGGRGLATAAGAMLVVSWAFILIWGILWVIGYGLSKNVNVGNTIATTGELLGVLVTSEEVLSGVLSSSIVPSEFRLYVVALLLVILTKHVGPMREYFATMKGNDH
jgi:glycerol-3-phosphate acyltransferase PlsY